MGILQLYSPKDFYVMVNKTDYCQGQFCWLPVPHINPVPQILDVERSSPIEHQEVKFVLRNANQGKDFKTLDRTLPIKLLRLLANEELLVQRAKRRLGIIISSEVDFFPEITKLLRQKGKKHLQEDSIFVIPVYSIEDGEKLSGFPREIVAKTRCLFYRQFFYIPDSKSFKEGIARFDRVQVVVDRNPVAITPIEICLSKDLFNLFCGLFSYCLTGQEDENIKTARELIKDAFPAEL